MITDKIDIILNEIEHSDKCKDKSIIINEELIDNLEKRGMKTNEEAAKIIEALEEGGIVE